MLSYCHTYIHTYILQRQVQQKNTRQGSATRFGLTNMFDNDEDDDDGDHDKRMFCTIYPTGVPALSSPAERVFNQVKILNPHRPLFS